MLNKAINAHKDALKEDGGRPYDMFSRIPAWHDDIAEEVSNNAAKDLMLIPFMQHYDNLKPYIDDVKKNLYSDTRDLTTEEQVDLYHSIMGKM